MKRLGFYGGQNMATQQVENTAREFVEFVVSRYGVASGHARARRMTHDAHYRHKPQWLARAIQILADMERKESTR